MPQRNLWFHLKQDNIFRALHVKFWKYFFYNSCYMYSKTSRVQITVANYENWTYIILNVIAINC